MLRNFVIGTALVAAVSASAATYTVTNVNDSGAGSLRQAILDANGNAGADTIAFNIPGAGVHTIAPTSVLPSVTDQVTIDGYTQPGAAPNTLAIGNDAVILIELDGVNLPIEDALFFSNTSGGSIVRGLAVGRWDHGLVVGSASSVAGCFVGLDATGMATRPNASSGITITSSAGVTIGGPAPADRNVVSANTSNGIWVLSNDDVTIVNNYVGLNAQGTSTIGTQQLGIRISSGSNCIIGGTGGNGNVAGGHWQAFVSSGVYIEGDSHNNQVLGNRLGMSATGSGSAANRHGIYLAASGGISPTNNIIGSAAAPNLIEFNTQRGVTIGGTATAATGNAIRYNSIRQLVAIDLGDDGATANDNLDADTGPNELQNHPVITSATVNGGTIDVSGTLNSTPNSTFNVQVYADASGGCRPGQYEAETTVNTDGSGNGSFNVSFSGSAGWRVGATATNAANSTSEFSTCMLVTSATPPTISIGDVTQAEGDAGTTSFSFAVTLSAPYASAVSVDYATVPGTATAPGDYAVAAGTATITAGQTTTNIQVTVQGDVAFEPDETFSVVLSNPVNGSIADGSGEGTIVNDDPAPPVPSLGTTALIALAMLLGLVAVLRMR